MVGTGEGILDLGVDDIVDHALDRRGKVLAVEHLLALLVDDLTLGIHDIVVFQHVLAHLEVAALDVLLRVLNGVGEHLGVDGRVLVDTERIHHVHDALGAEQAHDVILERQIEARFAGVALTAARPRS